MKMVLDQKVCTSWPRAYNMGDIAILNHILFFKIYQDVIEKNRTSELKALLMLLLSPNFSQIFI